MPARMFTKTAQHRCRRWEKSFLVLFLEKGLLSFLPVRQPHLALILYWSIGETKFLPLFRFYNERGAEVCEA